MKLWRNKVIPVHSSNTLHKGAYTLANLPLYQSLITTLIKKNKRERSIDKETITAYFPLKSHHFCVTKYTLWMLAHEYSHRTQVNNVYFAFCSHLVLAAVWWCYYCCCCCWFLFFFHFSSNVIASIRGDDLILGTAARVCKSCAATINLFSFSLLLCTRKKKTPNEPLISFHMHPCYFSTLPHTFLSLSFSSIFFPCLQTYIMTLFRRWLLFVKELHLVGNLFQFTLSAVHIH